MHTHTHARSHIQFIHFIQKFTKIFTSAHSDSRSQHCGQCVEMFEKKKEEKVKVWRFGLMNNDWIINASQRMFLFFCSISFFLQSFLWDNIITWIRLRSDWHELCVRKKCSSLIRSEVIAFVAAGSSKKTKKTKTQDSLNRAQLDAKQSSIIWIYPALTHQIQADTPLDTLWLADNFVGLVGHTFAADEKSNMISFHRIGL